MLSDSTGKLYDFVLRASRPHQELACRHRSSSTVRNSRLSPRTCSSPGGPGPQFAGPQLLDVVGNPQNSVGVVAAQVRVDQAFGDKGRILGPGPPGDEQVRGESLEFRTVDDDR